MNCKRNILIYTPPVVGCSSLVHLNNQVIAAYSTPFCNSMDVVKRVFSCPLMEY